MSFFCSECEPLSRLYGDVNMVTIRYGFIFVINCIRNIRSLRIRFVSQIKNIKRIMKCKLRVSNLKLPIYRVN